jgi:hydrogenase-4 component B
MLGPMGVLAAACAMIGLAPVLIASALDNAVAGWTGIAEGRGLAPVASLAPLVGLSAMGMALLVLTVAGLFLVKHLIRAEGRAEGVTWGCGYARPTSRMQYSSSSFAQLLVQLFRWVLRPHSDRPQILQPFCTPARFESHVDDAVLDGQILPAMTRMARWLQSLHRFQQGLSQQYVLYILVAVVALLVWTLPIEQLVVRLFAR